MLIAIYGLYTVADLSHATRVVERLAEVDEVTYDPERARLTVDARPDDNDETALRAALAREGLQLDP